MTKTFSTITLAAMIAAGLAGCANTDTASIDETDSINALIENADGDLVAADGSVDAVDLNTWQSNVGKDINGDGSVDAADFQIWQTQQGSTGAPMTLRETKDEDIEPRGWGSSQSTIKMNGLAASSLAFINEQ